MGTTLVIAGGATRTTHKCLRCGTSFTESRPNCPRKAQFLIVFILGMCWSPLCSSLAPRQCLPCFYVIAQSDEWKGSCAVDTPNRTSRHAAQFEHLMTPPLFLSSSNAPVAVRSYGACVRTPYWHQLCVPMMHERQGTRSHRAQSRSLDRDSLGCSLWGT